MHLSAFVANNAIILASHGMCSAECILSEHLIIDSGVGGGMCILVFIEAQVAETLTLIKSNLQNVDTVHNTTELALF